MVDLLNQWGNLRNHWSCQMRKTHVSFFASSCDFSHVLSFPFCLFSCGSYVFFSSCSPLHHLRKRTCMKDRKIILQEKFTSYCSHRNIQWLRLKTKYLFLDFLSLLFFFLCFSFLASSWEPMTSEKQNSKDMNLFSESVDDTVNGSKWLVSNQQLLCHVSVITESQCSAGSVINEQSHSAKLNRHSIVLTFRVLATSAQLVIGKSLLLILRTLFTARTAHIQNNVLPRVHSHKVSTLECQVAR